MKNKNSNPLISVLIPTYNRAKYIKQAIDSVTAQDYRPLEIIVVDDGSRDSTKEIVKKYDKNIVKYFYQKNKGISGARNACLAKAKGEYIAWLDSDDYYLPGKLTAQMNYMRKHSDCEIVFTEYKNFLENEEVKNNKIAMDIVRREKEAEYKTCLASSLAKKLFYEKVGKFPEKYKTAEDDFILNTAESLKINLSNFINKIFYKRRIHNDNSLILNDMISNCLLLKKNLQKDVICGILRNFINEKKSSAPAVSIIVPIYNTEPCLKRCLDSLINQTLKNIEIIMINDCSPDNSWTVMQEYAKKDSRIVLINHRVNKGVSVARNDGMKIAKGEYIGFVDSDDYVDLDFYEKLYKGTENGKVDVVRGKIRTIKSNGEEIIYNFGEERQDKTMFISQFTSAIYKKSFLQEYSIKFTPGCIYGEDHILPVKSSLLSNKIKFADGCYNYVRRNDSCDSLANLTSEKITSYFNEIGKILHFLNNIETDDETYSYVFIHFLYEILKFSDKDIKTDIITENAFAMFKKIKIERGNYVIKELSFFDNELLEYLQKSDYNGLCKYIKNENTNLAINKRKKKSIMICREKLSINSKKK
jgi:glycosyltransferase involved in cell wall biosynthesis